MIDADGTLAPTGGWCKEGMDIAYDGKWGYHPLVVSLANTSEPLYLVNRCGNRPSHEHAAVYFDKAAALCRRAGFRRITLRGDTDFTQTKHLDRWDTDGVRFVFGIDAMANLVGLAEGLPGLEYSDWNARPGTRSRRHPARPGAAQGADRRRAAVPEHEAGRRGGGRVRVPPDRLREGLPGGRAPQEAGGREGAVVLFEPTGTSSTSPTTARRPPRRSCSWPTTAATRRT